MTEEQARSAIRHRTSSSVPRRSWLTWLIGRPLESARAPHETIGKFIGLAVFASDALSSTAYATQESMLILAAAGAAAFVYAIPISIAIVVLLAVVSISYEQTIHAYPNGGGAYIVARDNLGELPAQVAGAALLTDYVLTVAVSISSGVAQLVSAYPHWMQYRVPIAVGMVLFIMLLNLRGVRECGAVVAVPSYLFIVMMYATVIAGLLQYLTGHLAVVSSPPPVGHEGPLQGVTLFLLLHAFSSGTAALTGVEAISNGTTAFREPRSRNAGITLVWMSSILGTLFLAITFLATHIQAVPSEHETVISQIARTVYGGQGSLYLVTIYSTTTILIMAANTSFAGFPRLGALLAADGFLPRQLAFRGSRLVYSRGIVSLSLLACALIIAFNASVTALIPLYAIGVFMSFTLSQGGMARRWVKIGRLRGDETIQERGSTLRPTPRWQLKAVVNGFGTVCTAVVMGVFAVTKFSTGAWLVMLVIPLLVLVFSGIHRHYATLAASLSLARYGAPTKPSRRRVILPVSGVHRGTLAALEYARSLSSDVTAVYVSVEEDEAEAVRRKWMQWGDGVRLVVIDSPYRVLLEPLLTYIEEIAAQRQPNETITVIVPQFVASKWWHNLLHTQAAWWLRVALLRQRGIVVTDVPYLLDELSDGAAAAEVHTR